MMRRLLLATAALAFACTPPPPPKVVPPPPAFTPAASAQRVVFVSFDGLGAEAVERFGAPTFQAMPLRATHIVPVNPTVSSSTHVAMLTGQPPEVTGVVSNKFHVAGTPPTKVAEGFSTEIHGETIVEAARRQGKRVGAIGFPTIDNATTRRGADFGLSYGKALTTPRLITLSRSDFHGEWLPPGWRVAPAAPRHASYSPVLRARLEWNVGERARQDVDVAAYDTTDDGQTDYDQFFIESGGQEIAPDEHRWFAVTRRVDDVLYGSWSKLLRADPALQHVTIYWGSVSRNEAWPDAFRRRVDDEAGFWPGQPNEPMAGRGEIDEATFEEQSDRLASYLTAATRLAIRGESFDLLLAYQPLVDISQHQFEGMEPQQHAYATFDRTVAALEASLDPAHDALVVTGDHGVAHVDVEVRINRILADWGYARAANEKIADDTRWAAYCSGNVAELYRFALPADDEDLAKRLAELKAPDGSVVVERIDRKPSAAAGDLVVYAYPRFAFAAGLGEPFATPSYRGAHGGLNGHTELHTTLGGWGAGTPAARLDEEPQTAIARYVSLLLEITPP